MGASYWSELAVVTAVLALALRYVRLLGGIYANLTYKAYPIPESPTYTPDKDVTVVIPTVFKSPSELAECIGRVLTCSPNKIFVVLLDSNVAACRALCTEHSFDNVTVLGVPKLGKRTQMLTALAHVETELVVWADDDVFWPADYLHNLIAIFENPKVGAGGTCQRTRRTNGSSWYPTNFWNILGISYLERRVFNNITTNAIDGSISTLSGRSSAYRTKILKCEEFSHYFTTDSWKGKLLNSDDDKCLTRYVYSHGWAIAIQRAVCLETTLEESPQYIHQCLRWARARFRGNHTVMGKESYWCSTKYAWGTYVIYFSMFQNPSLLLDAALYYLLSLALAACSHETRSWSLMAFCIWLLFTKVVRLIPHFLRHPTDLVWLPALIAFGYYHSLLNVYAYCTLTETSWGGKDLTTLSKTKKEKDETSLLLIDSAVDLRAISKDGPVSGTPSSS